MFVLYEGIGNVNDIYNLYKDRLALNIYIYNLYRDRVFRYLIDEFDVECLEHREARLLAAVDLATKRNTLQVRKFD